jgi:hypothetical protein
MNNLIIDIMDRIINRTRSYLRARRTAIIRTMWPKMPPPWSMLVFICVVCSIDTTVRYLQLVKTIKIHDQ